MKAIGSSLLILTPFMSADAMQLSPDQALRRLEGSSSRFRISGNAPYRLAYTETAANQPRLYVFNKGNEGFVIASADDSFPALLGYSDNGAFNPSDASPELKWWLSQYAGEAAWYLQHPTDVRTSGTRKKTSGVSRADIPQLLATKWNQGAPYNLDCPEVGGERSVTGCVATAMAQVIKYHGYPTLGSGKHNYSWNGTNLEFNYGATTFDYANMLDEYGDNATPEQQKAVASLMYACGVGVNMSYSPSESGAGDMYIPYALKTYFNYDAGTRLLKRDYFSKEEWEDLVYSELAAGRPVIYGGQAETGGHQFVCDGYEKEYFHINWGWGGMCDGFFLLSALDPGQQGIGGFEGGYNSDQAIVYGAVPTSGGTPWYPIYANGSLDVTSYNPENKSVNIVFKGGLLNYSPDGADLSFYIKCISESGQEYKSKNPSALEFAGASGLQIAGFGGINIALPSDLAAGEYKAYLGFLTPEGNWQDVLFPISESSYFNVTVNSDGSYSLDEGIPVAKAKLEVTTFAPTTTVVKDEPIEFDFYVKNDGDAAYSGELTLKFFNHDDRTNILSKFTYNDIKIPANGYMSGTLTLTLPFDDGEYDVIFYDKNDDAISDVFTFVTGIPPVKVTGLVLSDSEAIMDVNSTLQLNATVVPDNAADKSLIWSSSNPEIANVDQNGLVTSFASGEVVITVKAASYEEISASCKITVKDKVIEAEGISLDKTEATLTEGEALTLTATIDPETTTDKTLTWTSSNPEVAAVDGNGTVTALKPGTTTITVSTTNGKEAKCEITVKAKV
ncbi:MAG: C10 family peptidase, partial [Muribaculaceae bacterium]|nr:C10 family peptidase [Muribaculaceae bacterium]